MSPRMGTAGDTFAVLVTLLPTIGPPGPTTPAEADTSVDRLIQATPSERPSCIESFLTNP